MMQTNKAKPRRKQSPDMAKTRKAGREKAAITTLETGWIRAACLRSADLPAWLHDAVHQVQQKTSDGRLPIVLLYTAGGPDALVVTTLRDFLMWSHPRSLMPDRAAGRDQRHGKETR